MRDTGHSSGESEGREDDDDTAEAESWCGAAKSRRINDADLVGWERRTPASRAVRPCSARRWGWSVPCVAVETRENPETDWSGADTRRARHVAPYRAAHDRANTGSVKPPGLDPVARRVKVPDAAVKGGEGSERLDPSLLHTGRERGTSDQSPPPAQPGLDKCRTRGVIAVRRWRRRPRGPPWPFRRRPCWRPRGSAWGPTPPAPWPP